MELDYGLLAIYISGILVVLSSGAIGYLFTQIRNLREFGLRELKEKSPVIYDIFNRIVRNGVIEAELEWLKSKIDEKEPYAVEVISKELDKYGLLKFFNVKDIIREIKIVVYYEFNKDRNNYQPK